MNQFLQVLIPLCLMMLDSRSYGEFRTALMTTSHSAPTEFCSGASVIKVRAHKKYMHQFSHKGWYLSILNLTGKCALLHANLKPCVHAHKLINCIASKYCSLGVHEDLMHMNYNNGRLIKTLTRLPSDKTCICSWYLCATVNRL